MNYGIVVSRESTGQNIETDVLSLVPSAKVDRVSEVGLDTLDSVRLQASRRSIERVFRDSSESSVEAQRQQDQHPREREADHGRDSE